MCDLHYALIYAKRNPFKIFILFLIMLVLCTLLVVAVYLNLTCKNIFKELYANIDYRSDLEGNIFDDQYYTYNYEINEKFKKLEAENEELLLSGHVDHIDYHFGLDGYLLNFYYPDETYLSEGYQRVFIFGTFQTSDIKMIEGSLDLNDPKTVIVPEGSFYYEDGEKVLYEIGDTLNLEIPAFKRDRTNTEVIESDLYELKISGIYEPNEKAEEAYRIKERLYVSNETAKEYYDLLYAKRQWAYENASKDDKASFLDNDGVTLNAKYYYYHIYAKDYESMLEVNRLADDLSKELSTYAGGVLMDGYKVTSTLDEANKVVNSVSSMQRSINIAIGLLMVIMLLGMSFILQLFLKDRVLEMGINMSLGRSRFSLYRQYLYEHLGVLFAAFLFSQVNGYYLSSLFIGMMRDASLAKQEEILKLGQDTSKTIALKTAILKDAYRLRFDILPFGISFIMIFLIVTITLSFNFLKVKGIVLLDLLRKTD